MALVKLNQTIADNIENFGFASVPPSSFKAEGKSTSHNVLLHLFNRNRLTIYVLMCIIGNCTVSGWGFKKYKDEKGMSHQLQAANVTILTRDDCQSRFKKYKIYDGMICAGGDTGVKATDACQV